jgi:exodeoxyribonuclease VII large subunit
MALLDQRRRTLAAEGLFDSARKRALPFLPAKIGVVTSPTGAVIRDILHRLEDRCPTHVLVWPVAVQGEGAAAQIAAAISGFAAMAEPPALIIVARGGGSIEDLWAFNEEVVARAIRNSTIPVISAVGHETDFTIADFVADLRAPTPSAAAEIVAAHEAELCSRLAGLTGNLTRSMRYRISGARNQLQELAHSPAFEAVTARLRSAANAIDAADYRMQAAITSELQTYHRQLTAAAHSLSPARLRSTASAARARFESANKTLDASIVNRLKAARQQFGIAAAALDAMSPLRVLERGYAIAQNAQGQAVREASTMAAGDEVRLRLWKGSLDCRVEGTNVK